MILLLEAALRSWPFDPWLTAGILLTATVYVRGWRRYASRDPRRWTWARPAAFLAGLMAVFLALASPIEPFASLFISAHMVQHLLLMMAAPPLLWLGAPLLPIVRGLPVSVRTYWIAPLFRMKLLRRIAAGITYPWPALVIFLTVTWAWHVPAAYDLALSDPVWHYVQHACFLGAGLLFWFPVVQPYPARRTWPTWYLLPYLLAADVSNTVLSALLTFSDRILYSHYETMPRFAGNLADDQSLAGVLMWVPGSIAFLVPLGSIGLRLMFGEAETHEPSRAMPAGTKFALPVLSSQPEPRLDVLRWPLIGPFLRWRHARVALQLPLLLLAVVLVIDGLTGPEVGAMNLAGVLPWIHWRGLLVIGLLAVGNIFCTACPFMLPRTLARRILPRGMSWPRRLRSKWLAVALLVLFFTAYEAFALWDRPRLTAIIILAYFTAAFVVDGLFRGASFCKFVCPIGQFNFVQSLISPLEVMVRDPAVCTTCRTKDCIRGRDGIPGCELGLYQPRKLGNMDCTFCLDCAHACPHGNIGLMPQASLTALSQDRFRSGVGRFRQRKDLAALVLVLVFAAFSNAAGMTGPVLELQESLRQKLGLVSLTPIVLGFSIGSMVLLPYLLVMWAAGLSREWGNGKVRLDTIATRFTYALIPLGFGMWIAHYGYHFATSYDVAWPVTQRFVIEHGLMNLGAPEWVCGCCIPAGAWLIRVELLVLDVGLLLSLYLAYRIAEIEAPKGRALPTFLPWGVLILALFAFGVWVLLQPMEMRGTMMTG